MIPEINHKPIIGNLFDFKKDKIALLEKVRKECGDIGTFSLFRQKIIVISSAELAKSVLIDHADTFEKGPLIRKFARSVLGEGLISSKNSNHKINRKLLADLFSPELLKHFNNEIIRITLILISEWEDDSEVDISEQMLKLSLRIIIYLLFAVDLENKDASQLANAMNTILYYLTDAIDTPITFPIYIPTKKNRKIYQAINLIDSFINQMISQHNDPLKSQMSILSLLLNKKDNNGNELTKKSIRDEIITFFVAGHETIATSLTWTWLLLLNHPDVYQKLVNESDIYFASKVNIENHSTLLEYTNQVFKESLRLYPPVHSLGRQSADQVNINGYKLKPGAILIVSPYLIHRREEYFYLPDRFLPERFAKNIENIIDAGNEPKIHSGLNNKILPFTYMPFGAGVRQCIGERLALIEARTIIAIIANKIIFEKIAEVRMEAEMLITLKPKFNNIVRIKKRKGKLF